MTTKKPKPVSVTVRGFIWRSLSGKNFGVDLLAKDETLLRALVPKPNDDLAVTITITPRSRRKRSTKP